MAGEYTSTESGWQWQDPEDTVLVRGGDVEGSGSGSGSGSGEEELSEGSSGFDDEDDYMEEGPGGFNGNLSPQTVPQLPLLFRHFEVSIVIFVLQAL